MKFNTTSAPHMPAPISVQKVMLWVWIALVPAIFAHMFYFGVGLVIQLVLAIAFAYLFEIISLKLRGLPLQPFVYDLSAMVTAILFALCVSPIAPWWISCVGMFFAIAVAKHLYGGIGHNVFNPAMVGFAVVLVAFPQPMSAWLAPMEIALHDLSLMDYLNVVFLQRFPENIGYDSITSATPLIAVQTGLQQGFALSEVRSDVLFGDFGGLGWEWIGNWLFLGGVLLMYKRIITWHVPAAVLMTTIAFSLPFYWYDADRFLSPLQHIFSGGLMLGAFFIATDPVSGCSSNRGKLIFGAGIAIITVLIRDFGAFPDGVAFAVLLMNMAAPLIDRLTIPKPYGQKDS